MSARARTEREGEKERENVCVCVYMHELVVGGRRHLESATTCF